MEIEKTDYYIRVIGSDNQGEFQVRIQKDCSQLEIESGDDSVFIDVNYRELKVIRDCISEVLEGYYKNKA